MNDATTSGRISIIWYDTLYKFDAIGKLHQYTTGYDSNGMFYIEHGYVFKDDGSAAKLVLFKRYVPPNVKLRTAMLAAAEVARVRLEEMIRKHKFHPWDGVPMCTAVEWNKIFDDDRKYPSVCKNWLDIKPEEKICDEKHPWLGQYKANGERITVWQRRGDIKLYSRTCLEREFMSEIRTQLAALLSLIYFVINNSDDFPETIDFGLDGEIHIFHDFFGTPRSTSEINEDKNINFTWFDIMHYDTLGGGGHILVGAMTAEQRFVVMDKVRIIVETTGVKEEGFPNIIFMTSKRLTSLEQIYEFKSEAVKEGYEEGIVLRRPYLVYGDHYERKHHEMVKMKKFQDAEFEVVGFKSDGNACITWTLKDLRRKHVIFNCKQIGTLELQRKLYHVGNDYVGKHLTVRFQDRTAEGFPNEPRVLRFRPDYDLVANDIDIIPSIHNSEAHF